MPAPAPEVAAEPTRALQVVLPAQVVHAPCRLCYQAFLADLSACPACQYPLAAGDRGRWTGARSPRLESELAALAGVSRTLGVAACITCPALALAIGTAAAWLYSAAFLAAGVLCTAAGLLLNQFDARGAWVAASGLGLTGLLASAGGLAWLPGALGLWAGTLGAFFVTCAVLCALPATRRILLPAYQLTFKPHVAGGRPAPLVPYVLWLLVAAAVPCALLAFLRP